MRTTLTVLLCKAKAAAITDRYAWLMATKAQQLTTFDNRCGLQATLSESWAAIRRDRLSALGPGRVTGQDDIKQASALEIRIAIAIYYLALAARHSITHPFPEKLQALGYWRQARD